MRQHWPFALLATLALALVLTNLGSDYLWEDEGDTAVLASNILKFGVPQAWDGVTFIDADRGTRVNDDLVMVSHPWAQYYVAAASFLLFGQNTFAARLPFALGAWVTILLVYIFTWRITANRRSAFGAAALTALSVQFLLYARQCRNYSLNMLVSLCLLWVFFRMRSARQCVLFALAAVLSFHTYPLGLVPVGALGILTLVYRPFAEQRRWFWFALPVVIIFTLPWLALARPGYTEATALAGSAGQFFARFAQYLVECASVTPLVGSVIVFSLCLLLWRFGSSPTNAESTAEPPAASPFLKTEEAAFLLFTCVTIVFYGLAIALTQSTNALWQLGVRYATPVIPLMAMVAGILIVKVSRGRIALWLALLLIFAFTKTPLLTPWMSWSASGSLSVGGYLVAAHLPATLIDCFLGGGQMTFVRDLGRKNPGTVAQTCEFLGKHAQFGDVLITNYEWEPLYFHTRLPQGMKILPGYPIYELARRKNLPEYVFGVDRARWVVWRVVWEGYQNYEWGELQRQIQEQGGTLRQVAEIEETTWENRENIHFRRFSGDKYFFPWRERLPACGIFRVEWPDDQRFNRSGSP